MVLTGCSGPSDMGRGWIAAKALHELHLSGICSYLAGGRIHSSLTLALFRQVGFHLFDSQPGLHAYKRGPQYTGSLGSAGSNEERRQGLNCGPAYGALSFGCRSERPGFLARIPQPAAGVRNFVRAHFGGVAFDLAVLIFAFQWVARTSGVEVRGSFHAEQQKPQTVDPAVCATDSPA